MSIKTQHGIVLMTVIMFLFIMSLTWLSFSFISSYESDVLQKQVASEQAFYAAEAGVQQALWGLSLHPNWMTDNWWVSQFGGTRGTDTEKGQQYQYYQWTGNLGLLWPGDIRAIDRHYTVRIRDHGLIKDKIVSTGTVETSSRKLETELASAFDYGLYSYDQPDKMDFSGSFTVSGDKQTGYVYAKQEISNSANLHADKITGNYQNAPAPYYFFPKKIPLPYPAVFRATINGTPTSTSIQYTNDTGEGSPGLAPTCKLYNITKKKVRTIQSPPDTSTNTITTVASTDDWANGDEIIDDYCQTLINTLVNIYYTPPPYSYSHTAFIPDITPGGFLMSTGLPPELVTTTCFPANFTNLSVSIGGNNTFSGIIKFDRDVSFSGSNILDGDMIVGGNAIFLNQVTVNGHLYVNGSLTTTQNLTTGTEGEIIVSGDININQVTGSGPARPLFIVTTSGNLIINTLGPSFYGLVYAGGNISSINVINIAGGNIIANNFTSPLNSGSITNKDWKSNLSALGFSNKDFVRPLLWRETE